MRGLKATANTLTDEAASEKYQIQEARRAGEALRSQIVEARVRPPPPSICIITGPELRIWLFGLCPKP